MLTPIAPNRDFPRNRFSIPFRSNGILERVSIGGAGPVKSSRPEKFERKRLSESTKEPLSEEEARTGI
ncbi:MAG TPA: hypothetical protein VH415_00965 [Nitrososphaeraceae archaeon]